MKLIQTTTLLLTLLLPINYALADTETDIINWLDAASLKATFDSATKSNVALSNITPIKLTNGENAYLASASIKDEIPRPIGYVLAIPVAKKAVVLERYMPTEENSSDIVNLGNSDKGSVLMIRSGGGGTGSYNKQVSIVKFDNWNVSVLHSSDSGVSEMGDCDNEPKPNPDMCDRHDTFLNKLGSADANQVLFAETKVQYDFKTKKPKVTATKILSFPIGASSENVENSGQTQSETFLNKIEYSKPTSENPDAPEKNPLSVETKVEQGKVVSTKIIP
jgi:hypothetical protein